MLEWKEVLAKARTANKFAYQLLDRMKADCEYFLGNGGRNSKYLWALDPEEHIAKMRELYKALPDTEKPEWLTLEDIEIYEDAMSDDNDPYVTEKSYLSSFSKDVPESLKAIALLIMRRFVISGSCDGMYICNCIANDNGIGDGAGKFYSGKITDAKKTAEYLQRAYGCNISRDDVTELAAIIENGIIDTLKARKGIEAHIKKCKDDLKTDRCGREHYLRRCIYQAKENLKWLDRLEVA